MSQSLLSISFYNIIEHTYCTLNEYRNVELRSSQRKTKKGFFFHGKKNPIYIQVLEHFWLSIKKNPLVKSNFKSPLNSLWLEKVVGMELSHIEKKIQGDQDHFLPKEMLISLSILKLHKNPWIWEGLRTIHFI